MALRSRFRRPIAALRPSSFTKPWETRKIASSAQSVDDVYDVVVVGGGMVGAAVACGLATSPFTSSLRIAIIDGKPIVTGTAPKKDIPDARVSSITPATVSFFKDVGAWEYVLNSRNAPFDSMQVWDYAGLGYTRYKAADVGHSVLGYVVENSVLISALHSSLEGMNVDRICPANVSSVEFPDSIHKLSASETDRDHGLRWATVRLDDERCLSARLVIGADGGRSKIRSMAGIGVTSRDYKQEAIICTVRVSSTHTTAWQRFLPTGPLALLPMGDDFSNIVWSTTPEMATSLKSLPPEEFVDHINKALTEEYAPVTQSSLTDVLRSRLVTPFSNESAPSVTESFELPVRVIKLESERMSFPLTLRHANAYTKRRLALVGDAAHSVHPLAGQGVNLGFGDAVSLVGILSKGVESGSDVGELALLKEYEKARKSSNVAMMAVLDSFQRIFSIDAGPVNLLRAAGFSAVQLFGPLKKRIISYAMSNGEIPELRFFK